jgi:hypothetical protein
MSTRVERDRLLNDILIRHPDLDQEIVRDKIARAGTIYEQNEAFGTGTHRYYPYRTKSSDEWFIGVGSSLGHRPNNLDSYEYHGISIDEAIDYLADDVRSAMKLEQQLHSKGDINKSIQTDESKEDRNARILGKWFKYFIWTLALTSGMLAASVVVDSTNDLSARLPIFFVVWISYAFFSEVYGFAPILGSIVIAAVCVWLALNVTNARVWLRNIAWIVLGLMVINVLLVYR